MNRKIYWGLGVLIGLFISVLVFVMVNERAKIRQLEVDLKEAQELAVSNNHHRKSENRPPPPGKSFKGGGHWHGDEWHDAPHEPNEQIVQPITTDIPVNQQLTYHAELLKTNPVKALRLQAEERGHWSVEYMPPFPPDDQEAAALAYNVYLMIYFINLGDTTNPIFIKAWKDKWTLMDAINDRYPRLPPYSKKHYLEYTDTELEDQKTIDARRSDLTKLTWAQMESPPPLIHRRTSTFAK